MTQQSLNNLYSGKPGIIIGRGPSLDQWLEGSPKPDDSVVIGINGACDVTPCDFSVSCDADANSLNGHQHQVGGESRTSRTVFPSPRKGHRGRRRGNFRAASKNWRSTMASTMLRAAIAGSGRLANTSNCFVDSTAQAPPCTLPFTLRGTWAARRSWWLAWTATVGAQRPAQHLPGKEPPPDHIYAKMRTESENLLNTLFPNAWVRYPN